MSKTAVFNWPEPSTTAIALAQTVGAGASMVLNGTLSVPPDPIVTFVGISRKITLTSGANLAGVTFTVTGTYLGKTKSEAVTGPNANTVESAGLFHTITSITADVSTGADTVSAGTGSDGHTNLYMVDTNSSICAISAHVTVTSGLGDITYTFKSSSQELTDANFSVSYGRNTMYNMVNATGLSVLGAHGMLPIAGTGATPPDYDIPVYAHTPVRWCWIDITGSLVDPASLTAYITQQGIV